MKLQSQCPKCHAMVDVGVDDIGTIMNCPSCAAKIKIARPRAPEPQQTGLRYRFECPACESQLEATESMAGQRGKCPGCAAEIIIPGPDKLAELAHSDDDSGEQADEQLQAVHAFAASGLSAPQITKTRTGNKVIMCPKCHFGNDVSATSCRHCALPFCTDALLQNNSGGNTARLSLIFALLSLPFYPAFVFQIISIIMAVKAIKSPRASDRRRRYPAYVSLMLAGISLLFAVIQWIKWFA